MTRTRRLIVSLVLTLGLIVAPLIASGIEPQSKTATEDQAGFSETFLKAFPEYDRFRDQAYRRLVAGDGLRSADPQVLFQRMTAAAKGGETFKALYLARVFTGLRPDLAAGWTNRAQLAASVGFAAEAEASRANATADARKSVPPSALPGLMKIRPTTLPDWAAALALVADDVSAVEGAQMLVAVRDDLSGFNIASEEEVQRGGRGPWASSKPVQVEHVLTNLFVMPEAMPMDKKTMKGGMFALGGLALAGSTFSATVGATDAARTFTELYGDAMRLAFEVPSELKDGSFQSVTFPDGKMTRTVAKPQTSGKYEAVGTPLPILWASAGSLNPALRAQWRSGDSSKAEAMRIDGKGKKPEWKKQAVPALTYLRVHQLCGSEKLCSPNVMLLEVLLTREDVVALAPEVAPKLPAMDRWAALYSSRQSISVVSAGHTFAGVDQSGVVYVTKQRPTEWLTSAAATPSSGK